MINRSNTIAGDGVDAAATVPRMPDSLWARTAVPPVPCPSLQGDLRADVTIVGGGFTGLSCALHLAEAGVRCIVLEAAEPGWGASGRNGGMLCPNLKISPSQLRARLGSEAGQKAAEFAVASTGVVMDIVKRWDIRCHADLDGWLIPAHSPRALARLERVAHEWNEVHASLEVLDADQMRQRLGSPVYHGGLRNAVGGKLHPLSYARGLAAAAISAGATICGHSEARELRRENDGWCVSTAAGTVRSDRVLIATNGYTGDLWPGLRRTVIAAHSFLIATERLSDNICASVLPFGEAASDSRRLLLYFRKDSEGRLLLGGRGAINEPTGPNDYADLRAKIKVLFPQLGDVGFQHHWFGRICMTPDHLPHIHEPTPGLTMALGYNGRGVALASAVGKSLSEYFVGGDPAVLPLPLSHPKTIPLHKWQNQIRAAAVAYYRVRDTLEAW